MTSGQIPRSALFAHIFTRSGNRGRTFTCIEKSSAQENSIHVCNTDRVHRDEFLQICESCGTRHDRGVGCFAQPPLPRGCEWRTFMTTRFQTICPSSDGIPFARGMSNLSGTSHSTSSKHQLVDDQHERVCAWQFASPLHAKPQLKNIES